MAFNLVVLASGRATYNHCLNYIMYELENPFAAQSFSDDFYNTLDVIAENPLSYGLCDLARLHERGLRKKHLKKHKYKIFYHVEGDDIYVEAVLHDKQDFENILK